MVHRPTFPSQRSAAIFDELLERGDLDEDTALYLTHRIAGHFQWAGVFLTREDAGTHLGRPLTDHEFDLLTSDYGWRKIDDVLADDDLSSILEQAFVDAGIDHEVPDHGPEN